MATATVKRQKTRQQVKRAPSKKVTKGLVGNILADFAVQLIPIQHQSINGHRDIAPVALVVKVQRT